MTRRSLDWLARLVEQLQLGARYALGIEQRLRALERGKNLKALASRTIGGQPSPAYFNERFRDYELALMNIKMFGYHLGSVRAERRPVSTGNGPLSVALTSRMCTQADMDSAWLAFWCQECRVPFAYHRKWWEMCFVAQAIFNAGKLVPEATGLGFGCGGEVLPSLFAKYGTSVLAIDQEPDAAAEQGWTATGQHAANIEKLRLSHVCPDLAKLARIDFRFVDMNAIPADLAGRFDFCWSACALEHLGSIAKGLAFIENSLKTLKPGGVAVHALEYNLSDDSETIDNWSTVLFQKKHLVAMAERLRQAGYQVSELDFAHGDSLLDGFVDIPPWRSDAVALSPHATQLKISVDGFACTSFGLIVRVPETGVAAVEP